MSKRTSAAKGTKKAAVAAVAAPLVAKAIESLKDPVRREQVGQQAKMATEAAKEWKRGRDERRTGSAPAQRGSRAVTNRRARRVKRLREGIEEAVEHDSELAESAAPLLRQLEKLGSRIAAADSLQRDLRKKHYEQIDTELDAFENEVMAGLFGPSSSFEA